MISKPVLNIILQILGFFIVETFFYNEFLLFILLVIVISAKFLFYKHQGLALFSFGLAMGFVIEWYLGTYSRVQFWENTAFMAIPIWLPLAWGYGFVLIYELGNSIYSKKSKK